MASIRSNPEYWRIAQAINQTASDCKNGRPRVSAKVNRDEVVIVETTMSGTVLCAVRGIVALAAWDYH